MRTDTKIAKLKAKFIKDMIDLNECTTIKETNAACRLDPKEIRSILKKHDPETFIKINTFIDEDLAFESITQEVIDSLEFDKLKKSLKFKKYLELYVSGVRKTTDFEKMIPCTRRVVAIYKACLKRAFKRRKQDATEREN